MKGLSYKRAGVDIRAANAAKHEMKRTLAGADKRVLNAPGAFASLVDGRFPGMRHPVLVLKTEEPGSKQKLAFEHGRIRSICEDMVNHLVNDIAVMGATPLSIQDCIVCGKLEKNIVTEIVRSIAAAARAQGAVLTGGETSEQPGVVERGTYILTSSVVGVAEKTEIIDGSKIRIGDVVLAVASNGLHTNGYSLVRTLLKKKPRLAKRRIDGKSFLDAILVPHKCYYQALRGIFRHPGLHGMAHITGGGITGNLNRILPRGLDASIDPTTIKILPVFRFIKEEGRVSDAEMLRTFNMGVGITIVCGKSAAPAIQRHLAAHGCKSYPIGEIVHGNQHVRYKGMLRW
jgi:phosphoribosylformylglycinamidine cyclo-ligase